jgi:hypothetical protein
MGHFSDVAIETQEPPFAFGDDDDEYYFDEDDYENMINDAWDYYANMCIGR